MFNSQQSKNRVWYFLFTVLFCLEVAFAASHADLILSLQPLQIILAAFATYRLAHTISHNGVSEWFRFPFIDEAKSTSGYGKVLQAKAGWKTGFAELMCCPICSGTHSAMILLLVYSFFPSVGTILIYGLGIAGVFELVHWMGQSFEWSANKDREKAGESWLEKNKGFSQGYYNEDIRTINEEKVRLAIEEHRNNIKKNGELKELRDELAGELMRMMGIRSEKKTPEREDANVGPTYKGC